MLNGQVFNKQLFESQIFALFVNTFLNGNNGVASDYGNQMEVTYSGSNVTIADGAVCIQGRFLNEDATTTLDAGTDAMYCKLVIEIDLDKVNTESDFEQGYYKIITSSSGYPNLTQTDIVKNNAGIYQYELARFRTTANGITNFQDKRTFLDFNSIYDEIRQHIQDIDDGSLWVQKTGDTMTGGLAITTNSLTTFSHKRTINDAEFETKVGTGRYVNDGESSLVLEDANDNVIGRLDVRADGKVYNGMTNSAFVEKGDFAIITITKENLAPGITVSEGISFPTGFNASNTAVLSVSCIDDTLIPYWKTTNERIFDYTVTLGSGINFEVTNMTGSIKTMQFKIVLVRI